MTTNLRSTRRSFGSHVCVQLLYLALLLGVSSDNVFPASTLEAVDLGIQFDGVASYTWCDEFTVAVFSRTAIEIPQTELKYLDIRNPSAGHRFPLRHARELGGAPIIGAFAAKCQQRRLSFVTANPNLRSATEPKGSRLVYTGILGQQIELVAILKNEINIPSVPPVNVNERYVLGNGGSGTTNTAVASSNDCAHNVRADYRLFCWPINNGRVWPLAKSVIAEYRWQEAVVLGPAGSDQKRVPNPVPPSVDAAGKPILYAIRVFNLEGRPTANLSDDPVFTAFNDLVVTDDEEYVYAACRNRSALPPSGSNAICRHTLDGKAGKWEGVFEFERGKEPVVILQMLTVSENGNLAFIVRAGLNQGGIWKFNMKSKQLQRITNNYSDTQPKISKDGNAILFTRREKSKSHLMLLRLKGG